MKIHLWLFFVVLPFLASCEKQHQSNVNDEIYRFTPDSPHYHNTSSLTGIDYILPIELKRAGELTNIDFRVLLLDSTPETYAPEDYAAKVMTENGIGRNNEGRGILIIYSEKEGVLKIEVSYDLEALFPDIYVGRLEDQAKNYFAGNYFGDFLTSIIHSMSKRQMDDPTHIESPNFAAPSGDKWLGGKFLSGGAGLKADSFFKNKLKQNHGVIYLNPEHRKIYSPDKRAKVVVDRFIKSLKSGINDPFLPLLTEGSQYMRLEYPKSAAFLISFHKGFNSDYELHEKGDLAAATFKDKGSTPVLLRRDHNGLWLVDVTKSWALSQGSYDMKTMKPAFYDHPWMFAFPDFISKPEIPATPAPIPYPNNIKEHIEELQAKIHAEPHIASHYFRLADVFYFECYWIRDAINLVEKGLEIDPIGDGYIHRLVKMKYRFPDLSRLDEIYARTHAADPGNTSLIHSYKHYLKSKKNSAALIRELEATKKREYLPRAPFKLKPGAGHYTRRRFMLPEEDKTLSFTMQLFGPLWHDEYRPYSSLLIKDISGKNAAGLSFKQYEKDGQPYIYAKIHGKEVHGTRRPFHVGQRIEVDFVWTHDNRLSISIDGEILVSKYQLNFSPKWGYAYAKSSRLVYQMNP